MGYDGLAAGSYRLEKGADVIEENPLHGHWSDHFSLEVLQDLHQFGGVIEGEIDPLAHGKRFGGDLGMFLRRQILEDDLTPKAAGFVLHRPEHLGERIILDLLEHAGGVGLGRGKIWNKAPHDGL